MRQNRLRNTYGPALCRPSIAIQNLTDHKGLSYAALRSKCHVDTWIRHQISKSRLVNLHQPATTPTRPLPPSTSADVNGTEPSTTVPVVSKYQKMLRGFTGSSVAHSSAK